jgi:hypothetical protein
VKHSSFYLFRDFNYCFLLLSKTKMSDLFSLTGKVAAITGCTKGIGFGMTMALAQAGAGKRESERER